MSLPKEFMRPVVVHSTTGYDDFNTDGGDAPWKAWFHRFVDGADAHYCKKPIAWAVIERECGEIVLVPMKDYRLVFQDRPT